MSALRLARATRNSLAACVKTAIVNAAGHLDGGMSGVRAPLQGEQLGVLAVSDTRPGCACAAPEVIPEWPSALRRRVWDGARPVPTGPCLSHVRTRGAEGAVVGLE